MKTRFPLFVAFAGLLLAATALAQTAEVIDLPTRPGIRQRMLVVEPAEASAVLAFIAANPGARK